MLASYRRNGNIIVIVVVGIRRIRRRRWHCAITPMLPPDLRLRLLVQKERQVVNGSIPMMRSHEGHDARFGRQMEGLIILVAQSILVDALGQERLGSTLQCGVFPVQMFQQDLAKDHELLSPVQRLNDGRL